MDDRSLSENTDFGSVTGISDIPKKRLIWHWVKDNLWHKRKSSEKKRNKEFFIHTAQELIATNTHDAFILETSRNLLVQQRIMDDTKARRRLERWARNTIISYLLIVFILVILNGVSQVLWPEIFNGHGFITDTVMTVILSTTTINIIGLGVIVLKGHFPNYTGDEIKSSDEKDKSKKT